MKYLVVVTRTVSERKEIEVDLPHVSNVFGHTKTNMVQAANLAVVKAANLSFNNPGDAEYSVDTVIPIEHE